MSARLKVTMMEDTVFHWKDPTGQGFTLTFKEAFDLKHAEIGEDISGCPFRIHERTFTGLSFLRGDTLAAYGGSHQLRKHADGTLFLFSYASTPTFDFSDRLWSGVSHTVIYRDKQGVTLLHCHHGAYAANIEVYLGLAEANPSFDPWLKRLEGGEPVG